MYEIGYEEHIYGDGITVIAEELNIKPNAVIGRGEMIDDANAGDYIN